MGLRIFQSAFFIAGIVCLTAGLRGALLAREYAATSGQGTTTLELKAPPLSTMELRRHWSAPELGSRRAAGEVTLGAFCILLALGIHTFTIRRRADGRMVRVHTNTRPGRQKRQVDRWFLWMNVRF